MPEYTIYWNVGNGRDHFGVVDCENEGTAIETARHYLEEFKANFEYGIVK